MRAAPLNPAPSWLNASSQSMSASADPVTARTSPALDRTAPSLWRSHLYPNRGSPGSTQPGHVGSSSVRNQSGSANSTSARRARDRATAISRPGSTRSSRMRCATVACTAAPSARASAASSAPVRKRTRTRPGTNRGAPVEGVRSPDGETSGSVGDSEQDTIPSATAATAVTRTANTRNLDLRNGMSRAGISPPGSVQGGRTAPIMAEFAATVKGVSVSALTNLGVA